MLRNPISSLALACALGLAPFAASSQQPAAAPQEPAASPQEPTAAPQEPAAPAQEPAASVQEPAASAQPAAAAAQPSAVEPSEDALRATHGDWEVRCAQQAQEEVCYISQVVNNAEGSPLLRAVVNKVDNPQAEAVLTIQAPLGVVIPRGLTFQIDGGESQQAPFLYCVQNGCYVRVGLQPDVLAALRRGANARLVVYSVQSPEAPVESTLSLMGFTRAYDELS